MCGARKTNLALLNRERFLGVFSEEMPSIRVLDGETGIVHTVEVSQEDAAKASQDSLFATQLMHNYEAIIVHSPEQPVAEIESSGNDPLSHTTAQEFSQDFSQDSSPEKDGFRWPHEAILLLLTVYKDQEHQIISGTMTMKKFWAIIASQLIKKGYNVNASQCKSKMAGLKNTYKSVRDHRGKSKYNKYRTWRYFDIMDEIFKRRPWVTKVLTSDSPTPSECNVDNKKRSLSPCKTEFPPKRLKQFGMLENIIAVTEENTTVRRKMHEEAMARQDKLLDILGKMPSSNSNSSHPENSADNEKSSPSKIELHSRYLKQYSLLERIITVMEESTTERKRMHEEAMARQDKLLDILEKILNK